MVLLCWLILAALVIGGVTATSAFIAQRDIATTCDEAAAYAAGAVDTDKIYGSNRQTRLPLTLDAAKQEIGAFRARIGEDDPTLDLEVSVDDGNLTVRCQRIVKLPFGAFFGYRNGLDRTAESTIRSPITRS